MFDAYYARVGLHIAGDKMEKIEVVVSVPIFRVFRVLCHLIDLCGI